MLARPAINKNRHNLRHTVLDLRVYLEYVFLLVIVDLSVEGLHLDQHSIFSLQFMVAKQLCVTKKSPFIFFQIHSMFKNSVITNNFRS